MNYGASNYTGVEMLVVFALSDTEEDTCCAYYYDRERDVRLSTSEMLEYLGISTQNFLDTARAAAGTYFDSEYSYMSQSERQESGFDKGRAWTISDEQINLDMPLFVNEAGDMMAIARISSLANGGWYYAALNLNFDSVGLERRIWYANHMEYTSAKCGGICRCRSFQAGEYLRAVFGSAAAFRPG